jgi:flagellin
LSVVTLGRRSEVLGILRSLERTDTRLSSTFEKLSSGQRINKASDDAAGLAIRERLKTDGRILSQAIRNASDAVSITRVAEGGLNELTNVVIRIQELAEQSANGTYSTTQRQSLDREAQALRNEYNRIIASTEFNGRKLLDGNFRSIGIQVGAGPDTILDLSFNTRFGDVPFGSSATGLGTFSSRQTFSAAFTDNGLNMLDLDGDGDLDLLENNGTTKVYLSNGNGTFKAPVTYDLASYTFVRAGNFNGDSNLDLFGSQGGSNNIWWSPGLGSGTFQNAVSINIGMNYDDFTIADIDGDNDSDVILSRHSTGRLMIMKSNGNGTFAFSQTFTVSDQFSGIEGSVKVGYLNNDSYLDIVRTGGLGYHFNVFLGNSSGTFNAPLTYAQTERPESVELVDVDGNGIEDAVLGSPQGFMIALGNSNGSFRAAVSYNIGANSFNVKTGDFNSDGWIDVVANRAGGSDLQTFLNDGDGTFTISQTLALPGVGNVLAVGDLNGDDVDDIAVVGAGQGMGVFFTNTNQSSTSTGEAEPYMVGIDLTTQSNARATLTTTEVMLRNLSTLRGNVGGQSARLETAIKTLGVMRENFAAAESRISDSDIATETANLTRFQILRDIAGALLAQANGTGRIALQLLTG